MSYLYIKVLWDNYLQISKSIVNTLYNYCKVTLVCTRCCMHKIALVKRSGKIASDCVNFHARADE